MTKSIVITLVIGIRRLLALMLVMMLAQAAEFNWNLPDWTPPPRVPEDNPMTTAKVELGRHLFYEKRLSITADFSCASCHIQSLAFTDAKPVAVGATGEHHPRGAQSLANVVYSPILTWANPVLQRLEEQALIPMFGEEPTELGLVGKEQEMLVMLAEDPNYDRLFREAFADGAEPVTLGNLTKALAAFQRTLISVNSPYDRYRYGGNTEAISDAAKRGEKLFFSERLECFHCHGGLHFTDSVTHQRMAFVETAFHNTGLYNLDEQGRYPAFNTGLHEITLEVDDMGKFRTPTLRNIAVTAPYMHDGSIATLSEVIDHYAEGGRTIKSGPKAGIGRNNPHKSEFVIGFSISKEEKLDLIAFLESLTDESFLTNPAFSDPHQ